MAKDYTTLSDEELNRLIQEETANNRPAVPTTTGLDVAKAALGGASSGATGVLGFVPEVASLPLQAMGMKSPMASMRETFQVPDEPKSGIEQGMYRFMEGFTPAAATALPAYAAGPLVGTTATVGSGLLGGFSNMAAKGMFPESPLMQTLVNLTPAGLASLASKVRTNVPTTGKPSVSNETGMTLTAGQRSGNEALLRQEAAVAKSEGGSAIFKRAGLANVASAEDFANKIQQFAKNPNLTTTQIAEGTEAAFNYQNNRVLNKFRVDNRNNFNAAKTEAGDARIFNTSNVNRVLDEEIQKYSAEGMPLDLQAYAANLKRVKSNLSKEAEPNLIVDAQGKPLGAQPQAETAKLTIEELQKNLESWGKAAKTGSYSEGSVQLGNIANGSLKKLSRDVLNAFRQDLDAANLQGVPGAQKLTLAREEFKKGLQTVKDFQEQSLVKFFSKPNDPTAVVERLQSASPTERVAMFKVLENSRPEILDSLRSRALSGIVQDSNGDATKLLAGLKNVVKQKSEAGSLNTNDFLFNTSAEKAKANILIRDLESITKRPTGSPESMRAQVQGITAEASAVGGGWTVGKAVAAVQDTMNMVAGSANSSEKLAWMMTSPEGRSMLRYLANQKTSNKPLPQTYADSMNFFARSFAAPAVTNRAQDLSVNPLESITDAQLEERIKALQGQ